MAVARKSAVPTQGSWFWRNSTPPLAKKRSKNIDSSTLGTTFVPGNSKIKRRLSENLQISSTNETIAPTLVKESGKQKVSNLQGQSIAKQNTSGGLPVMPNSGALPLWLLRLYSLHRYSSVVAFLFVAAALVAYGWTVYSQELWSQTYRRLHNLQRYERQLTTNNATLTNKIAKEAEAPTSGLVSPSPKEAIFLPPTSHSSNPISSAIKPNSQTQQQTPSPLGY
ncbi:MAG: hypothetical protein KME21_09525 [Desmonostoc vinosum HA7617-LM4]|jgi:hypothetical protein|nr:hypothetical protein [Desmonostoc vinosum HA7617-LM4]